MAKTMPPSYAVKGRGPHGTLFPRQAPEKQAGQGNGVSDEARSASFSRDPITAPPMTKGGLPPLAPRLSFCRRHPGTQGGNPLPARRPLSRARAEDLIRNSLSPIIVGPVPRTRGGPAAPSAVVLAAPPVPRTRGGPLTKACMMWRPWPCPAHARRTWFSREVKCEPATLSRARAEDLPQGRQTVLQYSARAATFSCCQ